MAVREGLLAVLSSGPRHGYQVKTDFEAMTGGVWRINVGQIYTTLDRLERDGMVAMDSSSDPKVYAITNAGRDELAAWWDSSPLDEAPRRDELMLKVLTALDLGPDHALKVISANRTALTNLLQQRRARMSRARGTVPSLAGQLVDDALLYRAESDLRWLDNCESRIRATKFTTPNSRQTGTNHE